MKCIAVDIGASSGKVIAGLLSDGVLSAKVVNRFENKLEEHNGYKCWNLEALFAGILDGLKLAGKSTSISIDTWGVDFVLLDEADNVIGESVSYRDSRTDRHRFAVDDRDLYLRTGIQKQRFNTIYQLLSIKEENPEYLEKAKSLLFIPDYFNFLLTGKKRCEYTFASTSNLLNAKTKNWDYTLIESLGLPSRIFLEISMPGEKVGTLKKDIIEKIGYDSSVYLAPSHDTASAVFGSALEENSIFLSSGTWSLIGTLVSNPVISDIAFDNNFTNEGGALGDIRLLRNIMGTWVLQQIKKESGGLSFDQIQKRAENSPLIGYVDLTDSRFLSPISMVDMINEVLREQGYAETKSIGECANVAYHSLAKAYKEACDILEKLSGKKSDHIAIVGGGSKDKYLNRLTAEYTQKKVTAGPVEGTAIGNLLFQFYINGEISLDDKNQIIRNSFSIEEVQYV